MRNDKIKILCKTIYTIDEFAINVAGWPCLSRFIAGTIIQRPDEDEPILVLFAENGTRQFVQLDKSIKWSLGPVDLDTLVWQEISYMNSFHNFGMWCNITKKIK